ncbi:MULTISPECIES: LPS export ABC transporter permease LptF [Niveibacterium]|uniref:Lipopolysaccharide export system permease protein LptF n=1 Tax=Niveibacterium microcysteis TaxID=2811415 RepID=A0ABX7MCD9_9RHOO|nr:MULTISPECIES: LPS export ABC transporter permease LptF [Niveibacterium]QSI78334.1 LPS export ABC transporter permease LptF [Niveibacterium microcysteis]
MVFQRAAMREFAANAVAIFVALFFILLTVILIRLLSQAAGGRLPPDAVLSLIGFTALNHLGTLLSLTLFISVLMSLTRVYRDSEMVVWFASGVPLSAWISPVLKFSLPIVAVIAVLSGYLSPWAQGRAQEYRKQLEARDDVSSVSPGTFREDTGGRRVFFVESVAENDAEVKNVFVSMPLADRLRIIVASHGSVEVQPNGDRFAVLKDGRRYDGRPGTPEFSVTRFDTYAIRIEAKEVGVLEITPRITPTPQLIAVPTPQNRGELSWRLGLPLAALVLTLIAVPLSFVNPRAGRAVNLLFAVFVFSTYISLLQVMQAWIGQGKIGFGAGLAALHVPMAVLLIGMFAHRMQLLSRLFRR